MSRDEETAIVEEGTRAPNHPYLSASYWKWELLPLREGAGAEATDEVTNDMTKRPGLGRKVGSTSGFESQSILLSKYLKDGPGDHLGRSFGPLFEHRGVSDIPRIYSVLWVVILLAARLSSEPPKPPTSSGRYSKHTCQVLGGTTTYTTYIHQT